MKTSFFRSKRVIKEFENILTSKDINQIDLAIAYVSASGLSEIKNALTAFVKRGNIRFVVGLSDVHVTQTNALKKLLALANKDADKRLIVKYHKLDGGELYPKIIAAKQNDRLRKVIIGSSSLASGEQGNNVEANVCIDMEDELDGDATKFELEVNNFFNNVWGSAKPLTTSTVKKYSIGERKQKKRSISHGNVPRTKMKNFIYVDGKTENADSFEVLCTDCGEKYVSFPIGLIKCDNCSDVDSIQVKAKPPIVTEIQKKKEARVKIDRRIVVAKNIDLSCPECDGPVGFSDAFRFWVICEKCAENRRNKGQPVSNPFSCWKYNVTNNIFYGLGEDRLQIFYPNKLTRKNFTPNKKLTRGPRKPIKPK